ncbi:MAG: hypothetical protein NTV57_00605 [Cyanobacteria bacterium]|nr:hypothetical protein [Cyanobacteriota bacterium]
MERRRDPWAPFRIWIALTVAVYAIRASFAATWVGALPGWVLLLMLLIGLLLAAIALLFPGRVRPWREGEPGLRAEIAADWRHWWQGHGWRRHGWQRRSGGGPGGGG